MSQYNDTNYASFPVSGAIAANLRVKLDGSGNLVVAGLTDLDIGTIVDDAFVAGEVHAVALRTKAGTQKMVASKAIALGAIVYGAAAGQVSDVRGTGAMAAGINCRTAATAAGDVIEIIRAEDQDLSGLATTASLAAYAPLASPTFTGTIGGTRIAITGALADGAHAVTGGGSITITNGVITAIS